MTRNTLAGTLSLLMTLAAAASAAASDDFADGIAPAPNAPSHLGGTATYGTATAVLGQPTTLYTDPFDDPNSTTYHASLVAPAFNTDLNGNPIITKIGNATTQGSLTVEFNQPIIHDSSHWYGDDFLVFTNASFGGNSSTLPPNDPDYYTVFHNTDMTQYTLDGSLYDTPLTVQVSPDDVSSDFITLTPQSDYYPTNAFSWDRQTQDFGSQSDFTRPVDPTLDPAQLAGKSAADAMDLYDGSGGGLAFSLAGTPYANTGIQYIRVFSNGGVVDAFSRVSVNPADANAVPEPSAAWLLLAGLPVVLAARRRKQS